MSSASARGAALDDVETPSNEADSGGAGESGRGTSRLVPRRRPRWSPSSIGTVGLWLAFFVPLVVALTVLAHPRWYPVGDPAQTELHVRDVASSHPPLIGLAGRIGTLAHQGSHPGPLSFWALWPFYQLFGGSSWALEAAAVSLHLLAIGIILWIAHRRGGVRLALGVAAALALLVRVYGTPTATEAWNPYLPVMWWFVFVLAAWSVLCDDVAMLPVVVFAGSFCMQTHLPYLGLTAGIGGLVAAAAMRSAYVMRGDPSAQRRLRRWALVAVGIGVIVWVPPVIEQLTTSPGNLSQLWHETTHPPEVPVGLHRGVELMLFHLNPWRLVVRGDAAITSVRDGSVVPGVLLLVAWAATVVVAWRMRHRALLRLHVVLGVAIVLAVTSMSRIHGIEWNYLMLWAFGITALIVVAIGWTVGLLVGSRLGAEQRSRAARSATLLLTAVVIVATAVFAGNAAHSEPPNASLSRELGLLVTPTARALAAGRGSGAGRQGHYLVTWTDPVAIGTQGVGLLNELERLGFHVGATEPNRAGVTPHRVLSPSKATAVVHLSIGPDIATWQARPGVRRVAVVDPRSAAQRHELDGLRAKVTRELRAAHLPQLVSEVDDNLYLVAINPRVPRPVQKQLLRMLEIGLPAAVFIGPPSQA